MKMKRYSLILLLIGLLMPISAAATCTDAPDEADDAGKREQWFKEMRAKKHEFLVKELNLTSEQKEPFFAIYDKMEDDLKAINDDTRNLERSVAKKTDATDAEYDAAIEAIYNQRYREWTVENKAKEQLSKILSRQQLFKLKRAEMKFTRALMRHHRQAAEKNK